MQVIKANGTKEPFSVEKVKKSIRRSGIPHQLEQEVLKHVESKVYDNIPTSEIYKHIVEFLGASTHPYSKAKFSLKQSIMDLGPTGYPFEDYIARMFEEMGYKTKVRQIIHGKCITHEIDVIAEKNAERIVVEAKFHNSNGITTDVHVSLYTKARFDDISSHHNYSKVLLVTNTKATSDAISYAHCVAMDILAWSYPAERSLQDIVEELHLYPITALSSLSQSQKQQLLERSIVLCKDLSKNRTALNILNISEDKKRQVLEEAEFICKS